MIGWNETASFPVLFTERLLLRGFTMEDVPAVFAIFSREDVNTWTETDTMRSLEEAETRVKSRMNLFKDRMGIRWAITLRENPKDVIGSCGYSACVVERKPLRPVTISTRITGTRA